MKNNELTTDTGTDLSGLTEKQRQMFWMLRQQVQEQEARRLNAPSLMNKAPKGGWTDADRVK